MPKLCGSGLAQATRHLIEELERCGVRSFGGAFGGGGWRPRDLPRALCCPRSFRGHGGVQQRCRARGEEAKAKGCHGLHRESHSSVEVTAAAETEKRESCRM
jgi:hypothetical protein